MKKIVLNLFVLSALILSTSCSSDDDNGGGSNGEAATITVDGQALSFDTIAVTEVGDIRNISMSSSANPTTLVNFSLNLDQVGADGVIEGLTYLSGDESFSYSNETSIGSGEITNPQSLTYVVETNSETAFKATVSGTLVRFNVNTEMYDSVVVSNGAFNVTY